MKSFNFNNTYVKNLGFSRFLNNPKNENLKYNDSKKIDNKHKDKIHWEKISYDFSSFFYISSNSQQINNNLENKNNENDDKFFTVENNNFLKEGINCNFNNHSNYVINNNNNNNINHSNSIINDNINHSNNVINNNINHLNNIKNSKNNYYDNFIEVKVESKINSNDNNRPIQLNDEDYIKNTINSSGSFNNTNINNNFNHYKKTKIYNITEESQSNYTEENSPFQKSKSLFFTLRHEKSRNSEYCDLSNDDKITIKDLINNTNDKTNLTNTNKSEKTEKEKLNFSQNKCLITSNITSILNSYEEINLKNICKKETKEELP